MGWVMLAIAIVAEVVGTISLEFSDGFTELVPTIIVAVGYVTSFIFLSQALTRGVPLGVAYAIWSGVGLAIVATVSAFWFDEALGPIGIFGLVLIIGGCVVLELSTSHAEHDADAEPEGA